MLSFSQAKVFQSTHSAGNATSCSDAEQAAERISIHAFRRECDSIVCYQINFIFRFQSTHSAGNATQHGDNQPRKTPISIHAFRRECDAPIIRCILRGLFNFNPRIPQGMRRAQFAYI